MKKSLVVLLIAVLAVSAAFADGLTGAKATATATYDVATNVLTYGITGETTGSFSWHFFDNSKISTETANKPYAQVVVKAYLGDAEGTYGTIAPTAPATKPVWKFGFDPVEVGNVEGTALSVALDTFKIVNPEKWELNFIPEIATTQYIETQKYGLYNTHAEGWKDYTYEDATKTPTTVQNPTTKQTIQNEARVDIADYIAAAFGKITKAGMTFTAYDKFTVAVVGPRTKETGLEPFYIAVNTELLPKETDLKAKMALTALITKTEEEVEEKIIAVHHQTIGFSGELSYSPKAFEGKDQFNATVDFDSVIEDKDLFCYEVAAEANYGEILAVNSYYAKDAHLWAPKIEKELDDQGVQKQNKKPVYPMYQVNLADSGHTLDIFYIGGDLNFAKQATLKPTFHVDYTQNVYNPEEEDSETLKVLNASASFAYSDWAKFTIGVDDILDETIKDHYAYGYEIDEKVLQGVGRVIYATYTADQNEIFHFANVAKSILTVDYEGIINRSEDPEEDDKLDNYFDASIDFEEFFKENVNFGLSVSDILSVEDRIGETYVSVDGEKVDADFGFGAVLEPHTEKYYATAGFHFDVTPQFTLDVAGGYGKNVNFVATATSPEDTDLFTKATSGMIKATYTGEIVDASAALTVNGTNIGVTASATSTELVEGATISLTYANAEGEPVEFAGAWKPAGLVTLSCEVKF